MCVGSGVPSGCKPQKIIHILLVIRSSSLFIPVFGFHRKPLYSLYFMKPGFCTVHAQLRHRIATLHNEFARSSQQTYESQISLCSTMPRTISTDTSTFRLQVVAPSF